MLVCSSCLWDREYFLSGYPKSTPASQTSYLDQMTPQSTARQGACAKVYCNGSSTDGINLLCDREVQSVFKRHFLEQHKACTMIWAPDCALQVNSSVPFTAMQPLFNLKCIKLKLFLSNLCFHIDSLRDIFYVWKFCFWKEIQIFHQLSWDFVQNSCKCNSFSSRGVWPKNEAHYLQFYISLSKRTSTAASLLTFYKRNTIYFTGGRN